MIVDLTASARQPDPERLGLWFADQRVFVSSCMADTGAQRAAVGEVVARLGAQPVLFEEFGRDADAEQAYTGQVDSATIYVAILNEQYGRRNPPGYSATEAEYLRVRERGKRIAVFLSAPAPNREGDLARFIDRVRFNITTESYADDADLVRRVERRLRELGQEALSPWIKLGDLVFRADEIRDGGDRVTIVARASEEIVHELERMRGDGLHLRPRVRFVDRRRAREGEFAGLERITRASGADEVTIELVSLRAPGTDYMRSGMNGISAEDLVQHALELQFLGTALPPQIGQMGFMANSGISEENLQEALQLPNEIAEAVTRLLVVDGLVGSGRADRVLAVDVGPLVDGGRRISVKWEEARAYVNVEPQRRSIEGDWRA